MEYEHLTIGNVSKMTNISERRLRYYDELGLCCPMYRNPSTGYRYYGSKQIPQLMWISYMRSLGMPVNIISAFFKGKDFLSLKAALDDQTTKSQKAFYQSQYRYEQILEFRQRFSIGMAHIRSRNLPQVVSVVKTEPYHIITYNCNTNSQEMTDEIRLNLFNKLDRETQKYAFITVGGYSIVYRNHHLLASAGAKPGVTSFDIQIKNPPSVPLQYIKYNDGYMAATAVHVGPYDTLEETYQHIIHWAAENHVPIGTDTVEDYQITGQMVEDPAMYVTQIYIPLKER